VQGAATFLSTVTASSFIRSGGTSSQFLKADGSVDSTSYLPLTGGTLTGALGGTSASFSGNLTVSSGNVSGGGIILADDGDIVDLNDGYASLRFSLGIRIFSANRGGSAVITLANTGAISANGNITGANLSGTNTGDVTIGTANGLSLSGQALSLGLSSGSANGALSSTDWTTFNNKQNALTNPVTGTGDNNYIAKFTSTGSTIGNSNIFDNGSNVGIGTASPTLVNFGLEFVVSRITGAQQEAQVVIQGNTTTDSNIGGLHFYNNTNFLANISGAREGANNSGIIKFSTNNAGSSAERMRLFSDGNLFVGSSPSNQGFKLHVNGTGRFSSELSINSGATRALRIDTNSGVQGISLSPNSIFGIDEAGVGNGRFIINTSGNVGIANDSPSFKLDVNGTGRYFQNSSSVGNATGITLQQSGSGDIAISYQLTGAREWLMGVDNSDSDSFKISNITGSGDFNNTGLCITTSGNVLIGTTTDNGAKLQVNGGITVAGTSALANNQLRIRTIDDANHAIVFNSTINGPLSYGFFGSGLGWTEGGAAQIALMTVRGNVGIGTASPYGKLQVSGGHLVIQGNSTAGTDGAGDVRNAGFAFRKPSSDLISALINTTDVADWGMNMHFFTRRFNATMPATPAMTISSESNVGIGTASPGEQLTLSRSTYPTVKLIETTDNASAYFQYHSDANEFRLLTISSHPLIFSTTDTERMRITSGGSVSINNLAGSGNRIVVANSGGTLISAVIGSGLAFDGTTLTATGGSSGSISGSGTSGTIALFTGSTSIGNSVITQSGSNVTVNGEIRLTGPNILRLEGAGPNNAFISESWGINLNGATTHPIQVRNASLSVGYALGSGTSYGTSNFFVSGNTMLGTLSDNGSRLRVNGTIFSDSSVTATSFFESSDATIKTLVEDDYQAKGIDSVVAKLYIKNGKQELGYFAQDLEKILPSAVNKGSDGLLNLSYREVHTAKIAYLEEQIKQIKKRYEIN
jgi:hypothetical protein